MERLCCYAFPGNVHELKNLMEGALLMCTGSDILPEHLQIGTAIIPPDATFSNTLDNPSSASPSAIDLPFNLAQAEVALVRRALDPTGGNVAAAARLLGISRNKVYRVLGKSSR
jgi:DNA-binding NtrC family response regulator